MLRSGTGDAQAWGVERRLLLPGGVWEGVTWAACGPALVPLPLTSSPTPLPPLILLQPQSCFTVPQDLCTLLPERAPHSHSHWPAGPGLLPAVPTCPPLSSLSSPSQPPTLVVILAQVPSCSTVPCPCLGWVMSSVPAALPLSPSNSPFLSLS